jgi:hypothetical protein
MGSQLVDAPDDSLLTFRSEAPVGTQDSDPAFMRSPTFPDAQHLVASPDARRHSSHRSHVGLVVAGVAIIGVLAGFAAGYSFSYRIIVPAVALTPIPAFSSVSLPPLERSNSASSPNIASESVPVRVPPASVPSNGPAVAQPSTIGRSATTVGIPVHASAIEVLSNPRGAQVFLDGQIVGRAPLSIVDVPEGTHAVRLEVDGFNPWTASVRVGSGSRTRVRASLER